MRIAAIDIGSNSLHMVIVEANRSGGFQVIDREKDMVRLGAGTLSKGRIPGAAMRRALQVLKGYARLAHTRRTDKILAVATSAVREAANGGEFLSRVGQAISVWPKVISGEEEARLIYLAALHSVHLEGKRTLVVDIGGGSVELALGAGKSVDLTISEKLGFLRLRARLSRADVLSNGDIERMERHINDALEPGARRILEAGFDHAVGTSGTILGLGALAHAASGDERPDSLHHTRVSAEAIRAVRERLLALDARGRARLPGIDPSRADVLHIGALLLDTLLTRLGVRELILCDWALREGVLLDYIQGHPRKLARAETYPDVRMRSVVELAERCVYEERHARHVAEAALALFDGTQSIHGLAAGDRALLEYAAILHDIGHHISHAQHHKHTDYLIRNGGLRGFDPSEIEIIATVARYHRRALPHRGHAAFAAWPAAMRRKIRALAGMLRLADALDRTHRQHVRLVSVRAGPQRLRLACTASADAALETWDAARRCDLLEKALGRPVVLILAAAQPAARARR